MTALKQYQRLESLGVWRERPDAQRRDVIVKFGDASLVMSDRNERALAHWSLAAVTRTNPGQMPAIFTPDAEATETLEIDDTTMIEAIEKVRQLINRRRPQPGRLRSGLLATALAAVAAILVFWMPEALIRHTVAAVPNATRDAIGRTLLTDIGRIAGQPCRTDRGALALSHMAERLLGAEGWRIVVLPGGVRTAALLPGRIILVNRALVEDFETPEVVAGFVLREAARRERTDPLDALLREAGSLTALRLLTTGAVPRDVLSDYAERTLATPPPAPAIGDVLARFTAARVPSTPYAYAIDISGEATLPLIEADPMRGTIAEPVLTDADWVSLQGICGE